MAVRRHLRRAARAARPARPEAGGGGSGTLSRVELIDADQAPLLARPYYGEDGAASSLTRALAQVPEVLEVALPFIARIYGETAIDLRTKEIAILRVSAVSGCRYCVETHTVAAWDAGASVEETTALCDRPGALSPREAALVAWCDAVCAAPGPVPDAVAQRATEHFADHELVELTLVAGATLMLNRFCTALELPTSPATLARLQAAGVAPA
jgi:AhpD family alkylhydroperoxidase